MPVAVIFLAVVALAVDAAPAVPVATRLYDGATYAVWQERMRHVQPTAIGSERLAPGLIALVHDREVPDSVRKEAALLLGRIGPRVANAAVPELMRVLSEPDRDGNLPRAWAAKALTSFGPRASSAAPGLCTIVRDEKETLIVRQAALEALSAIGTAHADVLPLFAELLSAQNPPNAVGETLTETAAEVAVTLARSGEPLAPLLVRAIRNPRASNALRRNAAMALGGIRPRVEVAGPPLAEAIVLDPVEDVREAAADSLGRLGSDALPIIKQLLARKEQATRRRAFVSLTLLGVAGRPLQAEVTAAFDDPSDSVRFAACQAWLAFGEQSNKAALKTLAALIGSQDRTVRVAAAKRLELLGDKAMPVRPAIEAWTKDPRADVRRLAERLLAMFEAE